MYKNVCAVLVLDQQEALTSAGGDAFTGRTNGFLASYSCMLKRAAPTARAVSVTVERTDTWECVSALN